MEEYAPSVKFSYDDPCILAVLSSAIEEYNGRAAKVFNDHSIFDGGQSMWVTHPAYRGIQARLKAKAEEYTKIYNQVCDYKRHQTPLKEPLQGPRVTLCKDVDFGGKYILKKGVEGIVIGRFNKNLVIRFFDGTPKNDELVIRFNELEGHED